MNGIGDLARRADRDQPGGAERREAGERAVARLGQRQSPAWRISASISWASATRMIASPSPVQEIAAVASSAQVPAAISGESPTRPGCLPAAAAGRGRRRDPPLRVARDRADRPAARVVAGLERELALLGLKPRLGRGVEPGVARVGAGRLADEHHVAAFVEHRARRQHRVADPAQRGHRARGAVGAAHDRGVERARTRAR